MATLKSHPVLDGGEERIRESIYVLLRNCSQGTYSSSMIAGGLSEYMEDRFSESSVIISAEEIIIIGVLSTRKKMIFPIGGSHCDNS